MTSSALMDMLRRHEGVRPRLYQDSLGFWNMGIGHLVDRRKGGWCDDALAAQLNANGFALSPEVMEAYLRQDLAAAESDVQALMQGAIDRLNAARYAALVSMAFNLGQHGFASFTKARHAIRQGRWQDAYDELLDSKWARQVPHRAREIVDIILHGA